MFTIRFPSCPVESPIRIGQRAASIAILGFVAAGCGSAGDDASMPSGATLSGYEIVSAEGSSISAVAGDAIHLTLVEKMSDGTTAPLSSDANVTWSGPPVITALPIGSSPDETILPLTTVTPGAMWVNNPDHYSADQLRGVIWILDQGAAPNPTVTITASVTNSGTPASATITIPVAPTPAGDVTRGQSIYSANCASCHGSTGQGSADFPGLNNTAGNVAADPSWNAALLAMSARSDMDNLGVSLDPAMPKWFIRASSTGKLLTTQDFADVYAWLLTQTQ